MRIAERIAKQLLERVIAGARAEPIVAQNHGEWDWDIHVGGMTFPMEVTQATSQKSESLYAAIFGEDGRNALPCLTTRYVWAVTASRLTNVAKVRKRLDHLLAELETTGLTMFDVRDQEVVAVPEVHALWKELRITDGFCNPEWEIREHTLMAPIDSAMLASEQVVSAVEREANKNDNRRKLGKSSATERHLFVHIAYHSYPAYEAMRACALPVQRLRLPAEITNVWVARALGESEFLLWAFDSRGWRSYGSVTIGPDAPDA
jgi:hypothetical protein